MPHHTSRHRLALGLVGWLALATGSLPALADGACFVSPARLDDAAIASFLAAPQALLETHAAGGLPLANQVRALVGTSDRTLDPILGLVAGATDSQRSAIGAGLARVAKACAKASPDYTALIQEKVAALGDGSVSIAFASALGDVQTTSLGDFAGTPSPGASDISGSGPGGVDGGAGSASGSSTGDTTSDNSDETVTFSSGSRSVSVSPAD